MSGKIKKLIKKNVLSIAFINRIYLKLRTYKFALDEKTIRGKIQQVGHRMDLYITSSKHVPSSTISEFEFLMTQVSQKNIAIDNAMLWAFSLYVVAKQKLYPQYNLKTDNQPPAHSEKNSAKLFDAILNRRSIRRWKSEPLPLEAIEKIIDFAKWAPSSCNRQLWKVIVINTEAEKKFLANYFSNTFWHNAPVLLLVIMDSEIYGHNEKHYAYLDSAAFIQNILLSAEAFGYGACWIGFACWDTLGNIYRAAEHYEEFYNHFGLKKTFVPTSMIALGLPDTAARIPPRQNTESILIKDFYK